MHPMETAVPCLWTCEFALKICKKYINSSISSSDVHVGDNILGSCTRATNVVWGVCYKYYFFEAWFDTNQQIYAWIKK